MACRHSGLGMFRMRPTGALLFVAVAALCLGFGSAQLTDEDEALIRAKFETPDDALFLRGLPRWKGLDGIPKDGSNDDYLDYAIGVGIYAGVPILFAVLSLLCCIGFIFCKCLCACCKCCDPKPQGYKPAERINPFVILLVFCAIAIGFTIYGYVSNAELSESLVDDDKGIATVGVRMLADINGLFDSLVALARRVVRTLTGPVLDKVRDFLRSTDGLETGTRGLLSRIRAIGTAISNTTVYVPTTGETYPCGFCQTAGDQLDDAAQEVQDKADGSFEELDRVKRDIDDRLVSAKYQITNASEDAIQSLRNALDGTTDIQYTMRNYTETVKDYEAMRRDATAAVFALPFLATILTVVGFLLKLSILFTVTWFGGWPVLVLFWLLLAVHLPLSIVIGDACVLADQHIDDLSSLFPDDPRTVNVAKSCLLNTSLVTALELDEQLNFTQIQFPALPSITEATNFTLLADFNRRVQGLTIATFGFNQTSEARMADLFQELNAETAPTTWDESNIRSLDPSAFDDSGSPPTQRQRVTGLKTAIVGLLDAKAEMEKKLAELRGLTSSLLLYAEELRLNLTQFDGAIEAIKADVQDLFDDTRHFISSATCGVLGDRLAEVKLGICDGGLRSVSGMSLAFFFIAVSLSVVTWISVMLAKRVGRPYNPQEASEEVEMKVSSGQREGGHLQLDAVAPIDFSTPPGYEAPDVPVSFAAYGELPPQHDPAPAPAPPPSAPFAPEHDQAREDGDDTIG